MTILTVLTAVCSATGKLPGSRQSRVLHCLLAEFPRLRVMCSRNGLLLAPKHCENQHASSGKHELPANPNDSDPFQSAYFPRGAGNGGLYAPIRILPLSITCSGPSRTGGNGGAYAPIRSVPLSSIARVGIFMAVISFTAFGKMYGRPSIDLQNVVWSMLDY